MLITKNDLTMKALWTPIEKVADTGDLIEKPEQIINTWIMDNKYVFSQSESGYSRIPAKAYILERDSLVKEGDKLDGVFVRKVTKINDFDGSVDHLEVYTY